MNTYDKGRFKQVMLPTDLIAEIDSLKKTAESRADVIRRLIHIHRGVRTIDMKVITPDTKRPTVIPEDFYIPREFKRAYEKWKRSGVEVQAFIRDCEGSMGYTGKQIEEWMEALE